MKCKRPLTRRFSPVTYRAGPFPSSNTAIARTLDAVTPLNVVHDVPSSRTTPSTPAYSAGPPPSSKPCSDQTRLPGSPSGDHVVPSQEATLSAGTLPTRSKSPPT
jgi:hypothetical protein